MNPHSSSKKLDRVERTEGNDPIKISKFLLDHLMLQFVSSSSNNKKLHELLDRILEGESADSLVNSISPVRHPPLSPRSQTHIPMFQSPSRTGGYSSPDGMGRGSREYGTSGAVTSTLSTPTKRGSPGGPSPSERTGHTPRSTALEPLSVSKPKLPAGMTWEQFQQLKKQADAIPRLLTYTVEEQTVVYQQSLFKWISSRYQYQRIKFTDSIPRSSLPDRPRTLSTLGELPLSTHSSVTVIDLFMKEMLQLPSVLASVIIPNIAGVAGPPSQSLPPISAADIAQTWERLIILPPKQRLLLALSAPSKRPVISFHQLVNACLAVCMSHHSLSFLSDQPQFQRSFAECSAARIFYRIDPTGRWSIGKHQADRGRLLELFRRAEQCADLSSCDLPFCYEHYYVLHCLFSNLDKEGTAVLTPKLLEPFSQFSFPPLVLQRVSEGRGRALLDPVRGMGFPDFCVFVEAEEGKDTPASLAYWHRLLDIDDDGYITHGDLLPLLHEQLDCCRASGVVVEEADILCQLSDLIGLPEHEPFAVDLPRLVGCNMGGNLVDVLVSRTKFLRFEGRDPFIGRGPDPVPLWDVFAGEMYERLTT
eukprot:gnl/Dysnectes_brevis/7234_a11943_233.p1 GENE.gnl/Dysnectes_brevis/7234_a11943_233~~gnl/Dysnectes_brevis/7234_a11943_233.p1  ORF type:complete len:615 (+),score=160.03 gnl/Dysnectes_brevis/7234_a11943_233:75-1847(+)